METLFYISKTLNDLADSNTAHYAPETAMIITQELVVTGVLNEGRHLNDALYWLPIGRLRV
ncbi:hypothetical protein IMCC21224_112134 [Puniceibacterium sp. IMCC21224]|nr:hypothetical protein IMCC21224_112134 [Puniceibacterium sp. IMCC21224]